MMVLELLDRDGVEAIHQTSLAILEEVGGMISHPPVLGLLADNGCMVDFDRCIVRIAPEIIEETLEKAPKGVTLYGRSYEEDIKLTPNRLYAMTCGGTIKIIDPRGAVARGATREDLKGLVILAEALNYHQIQQIVFPSDVPIQIQDIHSANIMLRSSKKPLSVIAFNLQNLRAIIQLAEAVVGGRDELERRPLITVQVGPTSPLSLTEDVTEQIVELANYGLPIVIGPCPLSGATAPVTLAGTVAQQNAEFLLANVIIQLLKPGIPVIYSPFPSLCDMRSGEAAVGAVEAGIMGAMSVQWARRYGFPSIALGMGTDSKVLDEQAALEKALVALLPALAGANMICAMGSLEMDKAVSFEQLVIDREIFDLVERCTRGVKVDEETLGLEAIIEVGIGGHFLSHRHTFKHLEEEHYIPTLLDKTSREAWERDGSKSIVEKARERGEALLAEHQPPPLDKDIQRKMDEILKEAERNLN